MEWETPPRACIGSKWWGRCCLSCGCPSIILWGKGLPEVHRCSSFVFVGQPIGRTNFDGLEPPSTVLAVITCEVYATGPLMKNNLTRNSAYDFPGEQTKKRECLCVLVFSSGRRFFLAFGCGFSKGAVGTLRRTSGSQPSSAVVL